MTSPSAFSGTTGVSAVRWLRSLKTSLPDNLSPSEWLLRVDGLLVGDAARWADQHPRVKKILTNDHLLHHVTESDIKTFTRALIARFPIPEQCSPNKSELQLMFLKQGEIEGFDEYYRRAETLLHHIGGVDRTESPLTDDEESSLKKVLMQFIHGIHDKDTNESTLQFWQQRTLQVDTAPPGLEEVFQFAKCVFDKRAFFKNTFGAALGEDRAPSDDLNQLLKESANQTLTTKIEKGQRTPTSDADVYPPVFQGKARLVNISPTKKKSASAPPPRSKITTIPKRFPSGTSLSDVTEEDYDPSMFEGPANSAPKTLQSKHSNSSFYSSYSVPPPGLTSKASSETVGLDTAAQDEDDLTIRAPTTPTDAVSPAASGEPSSYTSQPVHSVGFAEDSNSGIRSPDTKEEDNDDDLFGVPRDTSRTMQPSVSSRSPLEDEYEGDDDLSSEDPEASTPTLLASEAMHFRGFSEYIARQEAEQGPAPVVPSPAFSSSSSSPSSKSKEPVRVLRTLSFPLPTGEPAMPRATRPDTIHRRTSTPSISGRPMGSPSHASSSAHSLGSDILSTVASQKARRGTHFTNLRTDSDPDLAATKLKESVSQPEMAGPTPPPRTSSHAARGASAKGATTQAFRDI